MGAFWAAARSYRLLDAGEERKLGELVRAGQAAAERLAEGADLADAERAELERRVERGRQAKERFVCGNLRLVGTTTRQLRGQGLETCDLAQEGVLGLMRAVERFDPALGYRFSTFAVWWIRHAALQAIAKTGRTIRLSVYRREMVRRVSAAERQLTAELGREPTMAEVADDLGVDLAAVAFVREVTEDTVSLDGAVGGADGDAVPLGSLVAAEGPGVEEEVLARERTARVEAAMATLDARSADVLRTRFGLDGGEPRTLTEIGRAYGIGRERIRQIQHLAAVRLRDMLDRDDIS